MSAEEREQQAEEREQQAAEFAAAAEAGEYEGMSLGGLLPEEVKAIVRERVFVENDIRHLPPGTYCRGHGGHGLRLRVSSRKRDDSMGQGKRNAYRYNWIQRLPTDSEGRRRETAMGTWPMVTLAEAERRALENVRALEDWQPLAKRMTDADERILPQLRNAMTRGDGPTFGEVFNEFYSRSLGGWRESTASAWQSQMTNYVLPVIGDMHIENVSRLEIVSILEPLATKPAALGKVDQKLNTVLKYAIGKGHIDSNPAEYARQGIIEVTSANRNGDGHNFVPFEDAPTVAADIAATSNIGRSMGVLFIILTGCRVSEAVGATWQEIDFAQALWTIPADRMKTRKEHVVTLSIQAVSILKWAYNAPQRKPRPHSFVFQTPKGKAHSRGIVTSIKDELGKPDWTMHGWRKTFSTWANELGYDKDAIEKALAHEDGNQMRATYNKAEYVEERKEMLQDWADYVLAKVTLPAPRETPALW